MTYGRALAVVAVVIALLTGGLGLMRHVVAVASEADAEKLNRAILEYVAVKNPQAPIRAFQKFPEALMVEAQQTNIDHCLILAQAEVESEFHHDAVGNAGEIGLFQILPSTAEILKPLVGDFKRPVLKKGARDLGDLADPSISVRFAMAYLRDIMARKPVLRLALTEYNGGPDGRHPLYYRTIMGTYVEVLEHAELKCRFREIPKPAHMLALLGRV
jgi:soluble lytic murein transglycosylase-like protein